MPSPSPACCASVFSAVAAVSARDAWAVGSYCCRPGAGAQTLIEHWNGMAWKQVSSPRARAALVGVAATSAANAWAVGFNGSGTYILHWNGTAWKHLPAPNPGPPGRARLQGVTATSARNAWAVGSYTAGTVDRALIEHWNGRVWKQVASPNPGSGSSWQEWPLPLPLAPGR